MVSQFPRLSLARPLSRVVWSSLKQVFRRLLPLTSHLLPKGPQLHRLQNLLRLKRRFLALLGVWITLPHIRTPENVHSLQSMDLNFRSPPAFNPCEIQCRAARAFSQSLRPHVPSSRPIFIVTIVLNSPMNFWLQ